MTGPRVGLVLGAGGLTGQAFHAGVLAGIEEATGWDPRRARIVVGTSAGSGVGAYLRAGLAVPDYAALVGREPLSAAGAALVAQLGPVGDWSTPVGPRNRPRLPSGELLRRVVREPHRIRPESVVAVTLPAGRIPTETWAASMRGLFGGTWPPDPLWICAVRVDDARRVVFGREGAPVTDVATAVAASSAIPTYFTPVTVGSTSYVDGGVHSPTNADVLVHEHLDLVIVSSPMSTSRRAIRPSLAEPGRLHSRRRLAGEVQRLHRAGIPVVWFQPSHEDRHAMGPNAMANDRGAEIVCIARKTTTRRIGNERFASRLRVLAA